MNAINHENQIIGCVSFPDSSAEAIACCNEHQITESIFTTPYNRTAYSLIKAMAQSGKPVYPYGIMDHAKSIGVVFDIAPLLRIIDDATVGLPYLRHSIEQVKLAEFARQSELLIKQSLMRLREGSPSEAIQTLQAGLTDLQATQLPRSGSLCHISDFREQKIEQWTAAKGTGFVGIPSGMAQINKHLGGYRRKVMTIIGGYRGEGKSTLLRQELYFQALQGFKTLLITLEDPVDVCNAAIAGNAADVSVYKLDTGEASPYQIELIDKAWRNLKTVPMRIATGRTIDDCMTLIAMCKARYGLDCVGIDHIQHIIPYVIRGMDRNGTMGSYSGMICHALKEHDVAGLVASQFSRDGEKQARKPRLSDLRDSGCLEQDARAALLLSKDGEIHNIEVAKNNYGPSGHNIKIRRNGGAQRFEEIKEGGMV
jgi:replicative DNA helicase